MTGTYKRLTIKVAPDTFEILDGLATQRGITVVELIKRAVALDKFVWENRDSELLLRNGDSVRQIVFIGPTGLHPEANRG